MKRTLITLMAAALMLPLVAVAQQTADNPQACPQGLGLGMGPGPGAGDGPRGPQGFRGLGPRGFGPGPDAHGGPGFCGDGPRGGDGPGIGHFMQMADELGLTDAQREQFKKMQTEFRLQMIDKEAVVEKAEVQLRAVMTDQNASEVEVGRLIDETARARAEIQKMRFAHHKQMKGVLTAEQTKKLETLRKERREARQDARQEAGQGQGAGQRRGHGNGGKS